MGDHRVEAGGGHGNRDVGADVVEVDGDASKSAALNMSDEKAMSEPMRALTDQFLEQNQVGEELRKSSSSGWPWSSADARFG